MAFSIKIEHNHQSSSEEAERQAEQDQLRLDDEVSKKITKKKQQEKFEKTELPTGFTHAIPPEARKLFAHYTEVTKLTDNIHKSLASGKKSLVSSDDENLSKATPSRSIDAKDDNASNGNLKDDSRSGSGFGSGSTQFNFGRKLDQQPNFLDGNTGLSTVTDAYKHTDATPKQVQTEPTVKTFHQIQPEIQIPGHQQREPQVDQQSVLQSQNQTQAQIQTNSDLRQGQSTSFDRPGTQPSNQSTQGLPLSGQINSTSSSTDKNLNVLSKIGNMNAAEISSPGNSGNSDTTEPKLKSASAGEKPEDQDQAREAVQSMPENVQARAHQTTEQQDTPSPATTAPQQIAVVNAMLVEQKNTMPEGVKYNLNSWGGNQSVQITGTSQKGYKLQGSDEQVQQILEKHVDESLSMTIESDGLSVDLQESGPNNRIKVVTRNA